jgi:hypothetical protein
MVLVHLSNIPKLKLRKLEMTNPMQYGFRLLNGLLASDHIDEIRESQTQVTWQEEVRNSLFDHIFMTAIPAHQLSLNNMCLE